MLTGRKLWKITWTTAAAAALVLVAVVASEVISAGGALPGRHAAHRRICIPSSGPDRAVTIADLGHATLLLMNWYGVRALTDPTLFNRVGMSFDRHGRSDRFATPRRRSPPRTIAKPRRHPHHARAHGPSRYPLVARPA